MRIGINGFGKIGMLLAYLFSKNDDVELFIHEKEDIARKIYEFNNIHLHKDIDAVMKGSDILIGNRHAAIIPYNDNGFDRIGWECIDCIVESADVFSLDQIIKHKSGKVAVTGPIKPVENLETGFVTYNAGSAIDPNSCKVVSFGSDRDQVVGMLLKSLEDCYGTAFADITTFRRQYSPRSRHTVDNMPRMTIALPKFRGLIRSETNYDERDEYVDMRLNYFAGHDRSVFFNSLARTFPNYFSTEQTDDPFKIMIRGSESELGIRLCLRYYSYAPYSMIVYTFIKKWISDK